MRAAAVISAAVIAAGAYLAIAATLSVSTSWTSLGLLAIAVVAALSVMAADGHTPVRSADGVGQA